MKARWSATRLLLLGAFPRLAGTALIVFFLWLGFLWVTSARELL